MSKKQYEVGELVRVTSTAYVVFAGNFKLPNSEHEYVGIKTLPYGNEVIINSELIDQKLSYKVVKKEN